MAKLNWKNRALTYGLTAVVCTAPVTAMANWPAYNVTSVTGYGTNPTQAFGLNAYAEIAGLAQPGSNIHIFDGLFGGPGYTSQLTVRPTGWSALEFTGINDNLYMVGYGMISGHPTAAGAQYAGNVVSMVQGIPNVYSSQVCNVNHSGIAVGSYNQEASSGVVTHTFKWSNTSNSRIADWPNLLPGGINEDGTVVANNLNPTNYYKQAELDFISKTGATTTKLAPGDYLYIYPSGISTYGGVTAIGQTYVSLENASNTHNEGWAYNLAADQWTVLDAPDSPFYESHALGVDVWGTRVVGSTVDSNGVETATVWEFANGQWNASYLSTLIPAATDWKFTEATGINTYGSISGWGQHHEGDHWVTRAFVVTPKIEFIVSFPEGGIYGGQASHPSVRVNGLNPFAVDFNLSGPEDMVKIPRQVTMPGMTRTEPFEMDTRGVDTDTPVTINVRLGGLKMSSTFNVLAAILNGMAVFPSRDERGGTGNVSLRGTAGPSGVTVRLTSSDPALLLPAVLKIAPNQSMATFRIGEARGAQKGKVVTVTATYGNVTLSQPFTIN